MSVLDERDAYRRRAQKAEAELADLHSRLRELAEEWSERADRMIGELLSYGDGMIAAASELNAALLPPVEGSEPPTECPECEGTEPGMLSEPGATGLPVEHLCDNDWHEPPTEEEKR